MIATLAGLLRRDLSLALRQGSDSVTVVAFFLLTAVLFPLAVGPEPVLLSRIAAGVVWVTALLAALLSLDRMFQGDYEDGSLDLLLLVAVPLPLVVLVKALAHWLTTGLPLILAAPLLAVLLHLDSAGFSALVVAMALGTPTLSLIGAVGAALVLGARRGGVLVSVLILPLYVPVLVFGVSLVEAAVTGIAWQVEAMVLAALLLVALALCPWAAAAALRQAAE